MCVCVEGAQPVKNQDFILFTSKSACHSFTEAFRKYETTGSEMKDFLTCRTASRASFSMFGSDAFTAPKHNEVSSVGYMGSVTGEEP